MADRAGAQAILRWQAERPHIDEIRESSLHPFGASSPPA